MGVSAALLQLLALSAASRGHELLNEDVKRSVDLSSHIAKVTAEVKLSNPGPAAVHSFMVALELELAEHLAFLGVKTEDEEHGYLEVRPFCRAAAQDVYYRDEIGNISTSHLMVLDDPVEMEIRPRFPLFGGWKTHYMIGYNLPSYEYLYNLGDQYALKMRFIDHMFDEQIVDSLTGKIILPEGAKNINVENPYNLNRAADELHYTYLDTFGRPIIVAHKNNMVEQHIQDVMVHYTFNKILMLQEPLLVVGAFYILFFTVIIYVRLDFSITKDLAAEARMKIACITEQILTLVNKRLGLFRHYDEASKLKAEGSDLCDKVAEIQKLDSQVKEIVVKSSSEAERLVEKDSYIESEKQHAKRRQELVNKIDNILDA
ncbi:unnamed protein product, partial [Ranitomeya imitator]